MRVFSAQTSASLTTNASSPTPIPGLTITLPAGMQMGNQWPSALVILNVPNPYATGTNYPGGWFGLSVDGKNLPAYATFTYESQTPQSTGRAPTTLVVAIPLTGNEQKVEAMWYGIRGSTVHIDSACTLTTVSD